MGHCGEQRAVMISVVFIVHVVVLLTMSGDIGSGVCIIIIDRMLCDVGALTSE